MAEKSWLEAIQGHVSRTRRLFAEQLAQRQHAEKIEDSHILTREDIRNGPGRWDSSRVLYTTLGGKLRQLTPGDLRAFKRNIETFRKEYKSMYGGRPIGEGITAQQVINIAAGRPLEYSKPWQGMESDIDKARREITSCIPVSAFKDTVRFITNASGENGRMNHVVIVKFLNYPEAVADISASDIDDKNAVRKAVQKMRKGYLKFDCDCDRHRYFFRYVATIGGFAAGNEEHGFPKIRNPNLKGIACKHVIRVMSDIISSGVVQRFLEKHLTKIETTRVSTVLGKKQAEQLAQRKRTTRIRTSEDIKAERKTREELRKAKTSVTHELKKFSKMGKNTLPVTKKAVKSRRLNPDVEKSLAVLAKATNMDITDIMKKLGL